MEPSNDESVRQAIEALAVAEDRGLLANAAVCVAASSDPAALGLLGQLLLRPPFLERLDDASDPATNTRNWSLVLAQLGRHPSEQTGAILVRLASSPAIGELDDRRIPLLPALAAVRPMTDDAAAVMRRAAAEGYYSTVIPLLIANASPRALTLFEALISDPSVGAESRTSDLHAGLLPHRAETDVLRSVERLLAARLDPVVEQGLLETIFDYRSREWFGPAVNPPRPPAWEGATTEALRQVLYLAYQARQHSLSPDLAGAVDRTTETVHGIVEARP